MSLFIHLLLYFRCRLAQLVFTATCRSSRLHSSSALLFTAALVSFLSFAHSSPPSGTFLFPLSFPFLSSPHLSFSLLFSTSPLLSFLLLTFPFPSSPFLFSTLLLSFPFLSSLLLLSCLSLLSFPFLSSPLLLSCLLYSLILRCCAKCLV